MQTTTHITHFLSYLKNERRYSSLTIRAYEHDIEQFGYFLVHHALPECSQQGQEECCSEFDPTLVSSDDIKRWVMVMNDGAYKAVSVNRRISSLRSYFRYLCKQQIIGVNPTLQVSSLKRERRLPEFIEQSKMDAVLKEITEYNGEDFETLRDSLIILLFFTLGMRLAELTAICLDDFGDQKSELRIIGKGDKERVVPVLPYVRPYINRYIEAREIVVGENFEKNIDKTCNKRKESLFLTNQAKPINHSKVYRIVKARLAEAGVVGKSSPHVLRHTFATYMLNQGADLRSIQELLGHASLDATQIYTHNNITRLKEVYTVAHPRSKLKK